MFARNILLFFGLFLATNVMAQFEPKVDVYAGYAPVVGKNYPVKGGLIGNIEGKLYVRENWLAGIRLGIVGLKSAAANAKNAPTLFIHGIVEKKVELNNFTLFMGGSAGLYKGGQTKKVSGVNTDSPSKSNIGYAPSVAIQYGPYLLKGEYHNRSKESRFFGLMLGYTLGYSE